jgi:DNA repair protein RecO (recombination protein O)
MQRFSSPAIIMRVREFGEADLLVSFFTPEKGRLKGVAKGARRSSKRFVNCLDSFSLVELEFQLKRADDLFFLTAGKLRNAYPGLRSDYANLARASYMIELTEVLFPLGVADPEVFRLLAGSFDLLDQGAGTIAVPVAFESRAMVLGGYGINLEKCCLCGRDYTGRGAAVFKRDRGGIACLKCQPETLLTPALSPEAVGLLERLQRRPLEVLREIELPDQWVEQVRPVLKLHREYRLERRLRTSKYVA